MHMNNFYEETAQWLIEEDQSPTKQPGAGVATTGHAVAVYNSNVRSTHPLRVLVGPDEQVDDSRQGPVLSERGVVRWAQGQVSDQTDHGLDQGPATRGVQ